MNNTLIKPLLIVLLFSLQACTYLPKPEFKRVEEVKIIPADNIGFKIEANTVYYNNAPIAVTIKQLDLDVFLKDKKVGVVSQNLEIELEPKKETILPIHLELNREILLTQVLSSVLDLFGSKKKTSKFTFKGSSTAIIFGIETKNPVEFETEVNLDILGLN